MADKQVISVPSKTMSSGERLFFMLATAASLVMFLRVAFYAYSDSLRTEATVGWLCSFVLSVALWRLYVQARKMWVDNIVAAQIFKATGLDKKIRR